MKQQQSTEAGGGLAPIPEVAPKHSRLAAPKIVMPRGPSRDPKAIERERLLTRFLCAQGRPAVTAAANAFFAAGHTLPDDVQDGWLQLLEHADEARVREGVAALARAIAISPARRRPVLEQRLKRLEETAEDAATRDAATSLRHALR